MSLFCSAEYLLGTKLKICESAGQRWFDVVGLQQCLSNYDDTLFLGKCELSCQFVQCREEFAEMRFAMLSSLARHRTMNSFDATLKFRQPIFPNHKKALRQFARSYGT
jgi:hypothetical protein